MTPDYRQGVLDALGCIVEVCKHHAADDPIDGYLLLCDVIDAALRPLGDDPLANESRAEWVALRAEWSEIKGASPHDDPHRAHPDAHPALALVRRVRQRRRPHWLGHHPPRRRTSRRPGQAGLRDRAVGGAEAAHPPEGNRMTSEDRACPDCGGDVFDPWGLGPDPCRCEPGNEGEDQCA